jgi:GNAT superfamily N-acetyltransferase
MLSEFGGEIGIVGDRISGVVGSVCSFITQVFVAIDHGLVGFAGFIQVGGTAVGEFIYVVPPRRGEGIARELFNCAEGEARRIGCTKFIICAARERSDAYRKYGYRDKYVVLEKEMGHES